MSNLFSSGSEAVDKMGQIHLLGNIVPQTWKTHILTDKGRPYYLAIDILADIVHWYCPVEVRDEFTGQVVGWRRKFKYDLLQRNYAQLEEQFQENRKTIQRALQTLEELGLIKRLWRRLEFEDGTILRNVMFLELIPERVHEITYKVEVEEELNDSNISIRTDSGKLVKISNEYYTESKVGAKSGKEVKKNTTEKRKTRQKAVILHQWTMPKNVWTNLSTPTVRNVHMEGRICPYRRTEMSIPTDRKVHTHGTRSPYPWIQMTIQIQE